MNRLKLMCILAHPDDESLGTGGTLARYAASGVKTYLITATRGELGWFGAKEDYPGPAILGERREAELNQAAKELGICEVNLLDYQDGELDQADFREVIAKIVMHLRRVQPDVVITFDPFGTYGHPDHIAICQFTTAAVLLAANPTYRDPAGTAPHQVSKLYYLATSSTKLSTYQAIFGDLVMQIDDVERHAAGWPEWAITTHIDTTDYWEQILNAVSCHQSQVPGYEALRNLSHEQKQSLWNIETYYRAFSLVNSGREIETDIFEGLHKPQEL